MELSTTLSEVVTIAASAIIEEIPIAKTEKGLDTKKMVCFLLRSDLRI